MVKICTIKQSKGQMMTIRQEILEELMAEYKHPEDLIGEAGLIKQLSKALLERALEGEMTHHLGYKKNQPKPEGTENSRNGTTKKRLTTRDGQLDIEAPRDREATFDPKIVKKHQRRFEGFDAKII